MVAEKKDVEAIFTGALERSTAGERAAYLDGACGGDAAVRARVEELLRAHEEADTFLSPLTGDSSRPEPPSEGPGTKIGRYKLLQRIGEGGFGEVYMAEQEEPVRRKVALKIIKLGMDTKQVIGRFEAERQALAMMDHPNIAKVLEGGATESGRPYFVMELVKGIPFTEYCDKNNLSTRERLALFIPVCNAIQHAHNKGVIHRDIKPSNVLVTLHDGKPVPKVIDFGVAKATGQRLTEKTVFTEFRQFIGTPEYMSPEQAEMSGLDIDTRSDVYSLGVLLYEILTGTTPFDARTLREAGYLEITRIIREDEPPTPSTRLSMMGDDLPEIARHRHAEPGALRRLIRGDLDWIVMKALEKDRTRRYETANALAQDIEHYLKVEPVLASPPSAAYKFAKFVRRNHTAVMAGALVFIALVVGLTLATVGFVQARRERDRFQAVVESLQSTLAVVDPDRVKDLEPSAQDVLAIAREVVTDASPMPVSFGRFADLDTFRATNWTYLGKAVQKLNKGILAAAEAMEQGATADPELVNEIQSENQKLVKLCSGIIGHLPTQSPINGEYTHPLTLVNLMAAALDVAGHSLTTQQKARIVGAGEDYERAYDRRQTTYTDQTPLVEKMTDELELKREFTRRVEDILTPEQRNVVVLPKIRHRMQLDVLSPMPMVVLLVKPTDFSSRERVRSLYPSNLGEHYEVDSKKLEAVPELFDAWFEEVKPILETVARERDQLHIDQVITAGRAQANLIKGLLRLSDLDEKTRSMMLADPTWRVPRVTSKSIEELRKSVAALRKCCPDKRLADELTALARVIGHGDRRADGIPPLIEAIEIYQRALREAWNCDPVRYQLRSIVWHIVRNPDQSKEDYEVARRGAEVVLGLKPESNYSMKVLGVAQYRLGRHEEAFATLTRADEGYIKRYEGGDPVNLAFLAMTQNRLGQKGEAEATLARLRKLMESPQHADSEENRKALSEAESLFEAAGTQ